MFGRLLSRILGRPTVDAEAPGRVPAESVVAELVLSLPEILRAEFQADLEACRAARARERPGAFATLICRIEDRLAVAAEDARAFRAQFRERPARQLTGLEPDDPVATVLLPPGRQEAALCRLLLKDAVKGARDVLGAADGDRLGELSRWLEAPSVPDSPPPFMARTVAADPKRDPVALLENCAAAFYAWLSDALGARADSIYESAYRRAAETFGAEAHRPLISA